MKNVGDERHSIKGTMRNAYHKWLRLGLDADADARVVVTSYGASRGSVASLALWNVTCGCLSPRCGCQSIRVGVFLPHAAHKTAGRRELVREKGTHTQQMAPTRAENRTHRRGASTYRWEGTSYVGGQKMKDPQNQVSSRSSSSFAQPPKERPKKETFAAFRGHDASGRSKALIIVQRACPSRPPATTQTCGCTSRRCR